MKKIPLIMDCDPGLDDAIALLFAMASPEEINLLGVTTVFGNGPAHQTQANARRICELAGRLDMKVFDGCPRSMFNLNPCIDSNYTDVDIHGETGLGGCKLPAPSMPLQSQDSVRFIIETLLNASEPVTLAPTGPLTNIACAFIMEPKIKANIKEIVLMGGSIGLGNINPSAEYNFSSDPQSASVVFTSGVPIVMMGLDVTRQVQTTKDWLHSISKLGTSVSQAVVDMLSYFYRPNAILEPGVEGGVLHDPNVIAYLLKPELYKGRHVYVEIDLSPTIMAGRSTVDWYGKVGKKPNAVVMNKVDAAGFFELLTERIARYPNVSAT
jgi:purine nucleosidase